jgi:hypothetical protein
MSGYGNFVFPVFVGKIDVTPPLMCNEEASLAKDFDDLPPSYVRELLRQ